jgi:ADP-heptose:LPS heptosyltransferase
MIWPYRRDFRDRTNYLAAVASELAAPVLRRWANGRSRGTSTMPTEWRTGLIVGHGHIGDVLYRTCSLDALARGLSNCRWSYLTTEAGAEALRGNPALYDTLPWMSGATPSSIGTSHVEALRTRQYDVILCTESVRHHTALRLALRLGIPNRVAFVHKGLSAFVTHPVRLPHPMSRPAQFREMVTRVTGASIDEPLRPKVFPAPADRQAADAAWQRLGFAPEERVIACSMTTRQHLGQTPSRFFIDILKAVLERDPGVRIALCGTLDDGRILRAAADVLGPRAALCVGALSILGYAAFLQKCRAFFGSDSGPRHLANAAGIPVVFVRNLATSAVEAGTYCPSEWDAAPPTEYLTDAQIEAELGRVSRCGVATRLAEMAAAARAERPAVGIGSGT